LTSFVEVKMKKTPAAHKVPKTARRMNGRLGSSTGSTESGALMVQLSPEPARTCRIGTA
jgi:hypothetical protein